MIFVSDNPKPCTHYPRSSISALKPLTRVLHLSAQWTPCPKRLSNTPNPNVDNNSAYFKNILSCAVADVLRHGSVIAAHVHAHVSSIHPWYAGGFMTQMHHLPQAFGVFRLLPGTVTPKARGEDGKVWTKTMQRIKEQIDDCILRGAAI